MRTKAFLPLLLALLFVAAPLCAHAAASSKAAAKAVTAADGSVTITFAIGDPEDSEMGMLGLAFKNYVTRASKGKINIKLSYSGGLDADETFQFHRVQTGKLGMMLGGVGNLAPMVRGLGVVTLPYLFPNEEAVVRGTTGKAAELLNSYAEKAGLRILAWTYYGYRYLSNSKRAIDSPDDMQGLRIRVPQSLVMIKTYRAFGAIPMPVAWPMTRNALKTGLVDGQCYDYSGFRAMKFHDAGQKYITELHYLYNLQPLVIGAGVFDALSEADRKILVEAGQHVQELSLQYQKEMNAMAKTALKAEGVKITTVEDESPWRDLALREVWPETAESVGGREAINAYLEACGLPLWEPAAEKAEKAEKQPEKAERKAK
ncbi:MAG: TRAP transporter substrate-binding protein [Desulfovibrio sp.]|nr:TRAP transporter substrate-binding protein [Desulfovibrio sp.]